MIRARIIMFDDWHELKHFVYGIAAFLIGRYIYDRLTANSQQSVYQRLQYGDPADEWTLRQTIPDGKAGTVATLKAMRAIVNRDSSDPYIRKAAESIVKGCAGHDFLCEVKAVFAFVRDHITYRRDPLTTEYVQDTRRTLESGVGDCDCKIVALCALLQALGHKTRFIVIGARPDDYSHVYCEVLTRQHGWLPLDPTNEQAHVGWEAQAAVKGAFPVWVN